MLEFDTLGVSEKEKIDCLVHRLQVNLDIADVGKKKTIVRRDDESAQMSPDCLRL